MDGVWAKGGLPVRDVGLACPQRRKDIAQGRQRLVDADGLLRSGPLHLGPVQPLRSRQVDEVEGSCSRPVIQTSITSSQSVCVAALLTKEQLWVSR